MRAVVMSLPGGHDTVVFKSGSTEGRNRGTLDAASEKLAAMCNASLGREPDARICPDELLHFVRESGGSVEL